jgi:hypothetical protein
LHNDGCMAAFSAVYYREWALSEDPLQAKSGVGSMANEHRDSESLTPDAALELFRRAIGSVLESSAESSRGRPPSPEACRNGIKGCSHAIVRIVPELAAAREQRELAWLELFEAADAPERVLRDAIARDKATEDERVSDTATEGESGRNELSHVLNESLEAIQDAAKELEKAEAVLKFFRAKLAKLEAKRRLFEFWREYHLIKEEVEALAFGAELGGHSTARLEERIRKINRSLPAGYRPIPGINPQTIMYVPSSIPGEYLPYSRS